MSLAEEHRRKGLCNYDVIGSSRPTDGDVARGDHGGTGRRARVQEVDDGLLQRGASDAVGCGGEVRDKRESRALHHGLEAGAAIP